MSRYEALGDVWDVFDEPSATSGYPDAVLDPWRERYGAVPAALVEYYTTLGAIDEMNRTQDQLVGPVGDRSSRFRMDEFDDPGVLVFYVENQAALHWGVLASDVHEDDPRVHMNDGDGWKATDDTVSAFLIAQGMLQRMYSFPEQSEEFYAVTFAHLEKLPELIFDLDRSADLYGGVSFYGGWDIVLAHFRDSSSVYFGAEDPALLTTALRFFAEVDG